MKIDIEKIKKKKSVKELLDFGILNIDKPSGPTSFSISHFVCKKLKLKKTSHFGTLDPKVTGVLPIALNRGCRLTGYFLGEDKTYVGIMRFHEEISMERVKKIIKKKFLGKIKQIPPVKSRVKRQEREREIYSFEILEKEGKDFLFKVACEGGTYIRKLVDDLGKELKIGAHMLELRRTNAGIFSEIDKKYPSVSLYDFEKAVEEFESGNEKLLKEMIIPGEIVSEILPPVEIQKKYVEKLLNGSPLLKKYLKKKKEFSGEEKICVFAEEKFIGIYRIVDDIEILGKAEFVLFTP